MDKDELLAECDEAFDTAWKDKTVPGWSDVAVESAGAGEDADAKPAGKELGLAKFHSAKGKGGCVGVRARARACVCMCIWT